VTFIDSEKAFDYVKTEIKWLTLQQYGIPRKIIQIIKILYDTFKCKISHEGKLSDFIEVRNGVRQGCILSPTVFLLILDSHEKSARFKEKTTTVEYEGMIGRSGLSGCNFSVSPEILRYRRMAKETKRGSRISWVAY